MEKERHENIWEGKGKEFLVFIGKTSIAGVILGISMYIGGRGAVEQAVNPTIEAQGNKISKTMEDRVKDIEEIKDVASKVDRRINGISEDWEALKQYLETTLHIDIDKPASDNGQ